MWERRLRRMLAGVCLLHDHVHSLVRVGPADAPAQSVGAFAGRTAGVLGEEFAYGRRFARVMWSPSHFTASVGYVSETTVRRSTEHPWDAAAS